MGKWVYAGAIILGLGTVALALAQRGTGPTTPGPAPTGPPALRSTGGAPTDRAELYARIARLRAEVELLQLERDRIGDRVSAGLKGRVEGLEGTRPGRSPAIP